MPKNKVRLEDLKVSSFITDLNAEIQYKIGGTGDRNNTHIASLELCLEGTCPFICLPTGLN